MLLILRIFPPPYCAIRAAASSEMRMVDFKLTSIVRKYSSSVTERNSHRGSFSPKKPALFMTMLTGAVENNPSTEFLTASASYWLSKRVLSVSSFALHDLLLSSATAVWSFWTFLPLIITRQPSPSNLSAIAKPIPLVAPVTKAMRPFRLPPTTLVV